MTLQTAEHLPKPKEVFGNPFITNKHHWYLEQYKKVVCSKTNSFHKKGDVYLSRSTHLINEKTLKVSINGGDFVFFEIEKYITNE